MVPLLTRGTGFVDVQELRFKWPIGPWSSDPKLKEVGKWNHLSWTVNFEGWVQALLTRCLGVSDGAVALTALTETRLTACTVGARACQAAPGRTPTRLQGQ